MTKGRLAAAIAVTVGVGMLVAAAFALVTLMLSGYKWLDDTDALSNRNIWFIQLHMAKLLAFLVMLVLTFWAACKAVSIMVGRSKVSSPTVAIVYFCVTVAYLFLWFAAPRLDYMFAAWFLVALILNPLVVIPVLLSPVLYPLTAILLLVATVRALSKDGWLPGPSAVTPKTGTVLVALAWALAVGASMAYARHLLAGDAINCLTRDCPRPPYLAVSGLVLMVAAATVVAAMIGRSLLQTSGVTRAGIIAATAFGCLTLLFSIISYLFPLLPHDTFITKLFYGIAAALLLIVAVVRKAENPPTPRAT